MMTIVRDLLFKRHSREGGNPSPKRDAGKTLKMSTLLAGREMDPRFRGDDARG
jgi:hypothetical protein